VLIGVAFIGVAFMAVLGCGNVVDCHGSVGNGGALGVGPSIRTGLTSARRRPLRRPREAGLDLGVAPSREQPTRIGNVQGVCRGPAQTEAWVPRRSRVGPVRALGDGVHTEDMDDRVHGGRTVRGRLDEHVRISLLP